jgi:hypothetical protein
MDLEIQKELSTMICVYAADNDVDVSTLLAHLNTISITLMMDLVEGDSVIAKEKTIKEFLAALELSFQMALVPNTLN